DTKEDATHLVTSCVRVACGLRPFLEVFGTDYPTPDGTCIRDYIHVADLAAAHLAVADYLLQGGSPRVFNCGYGHGFSVWEVVQAARRVTGVDFPTRIAPRRPGDPPALVADATRLRQELGWQPAYDDLDTIVRHAWEWEKVRPVGRS
ncbi:MAG: GDP-mannose 4,6-dehydratase, partial [Syntrophomonadaceae bacterium]|nr:GDP-mannose 4,6-dehydratase [Syntrophomonadaceae bacterium]